jgi:hypothetical protein
LSQNNNDRLVEEAITLPYQEGSALRDANTPTEVISNYSKASLVPGREAFMIRRSLNQNETYRPALLNTMANLRARDELEKEGTN